MSSNLNSHGALLPVAQSGRTKRLERLLPKRKKKKGVILL